MAEEVVRVKRTLEEVLSDVNDFLEKELITLKNAVKEKIKQRKLEEQEAAQKLDTRSCVDFDIEVRISSEHIPTNKDLQDDHAEVSDYNTSGATTLMLEEFLPDCCPGSFERTGDWEYGDWDSRVYADGIAKMKLYYVPFPESKVNGLGFRPFSKKFMGFDRQKERMYVYEWPNDDCPETKQELKKQWEEFFASNEDENDLWKIHHVAKDTFDEIMEELAPIDCECELEI